jgi:transcriptional regulator with XRE-family HTH domain
MAHQANVAGQTVARVDSKFPDVSVAAGRKGFKAELDALRERMRGLGFSTDEIAAEIGRRYRLRPREAYRLAWGWSLERAAARFNLAGIYETDVLCLLDLADHESLPQQDRLVLLRRPRAATPFGEKVVALMEARGLSAAETARRMACSAGYLCNVIHGRKRPSRRVAARLDDLLKADGELVALAETAEVVAGDGEPAPRRDLPGQAGDPRAAVSGGLSLSLPYVPGRLVIEVSGPAAGTGQVTGDVAGGEITSGRLALVRDAVPSSGAARAERTG